MNHLISFQSFLFFDVYFKSDLLVALVFHSFYCKDLGLLSPMNYEVNILQKSLRIIPTTPDFSKQLCQLKRILDKLMERHSKLR